MDSAIEKKDSNRAPGVSALKRVMLFGFCGAAFFAPMSISISTVFALLSLAIWVFSGKIYSERHSWLKKQWVLPVVLFMVLPLIGMFYTEDVFMGLREAKKGYYWFYAFAAATIASRGRPARNVAWSYIAGLSVCAVIYILQFKGIIPKYEESSLGFIKYITFSLFLVFGMLVLSYHFKNSRNRKTRAAISALLLLFFVNLVIIPGRAGYLAFVIMSPYIVLMITSKRHVLKAAAVLVLLSCSMIFSPIVRARVAEAVSDIEKYCNGNAYTSVGLRLHMWNGAVRIFLKHPLFGTGTGGFGVAMKEYETPSLEGMEFGQPHNSFLYMAASYGVFGLVTIVWLFTTLLRNGWRNREKFSGFALFSFAMIVIIGSLTGTQILQGQSAMLLAFFTGLGASHDG